jgi:uncharacterized protein
VENQDMSVKKRPLAVVTGASSGIGFELAKQFARNGYNLLIVAENDEIFSAADAIQHLNVDVTPLKIDLSVYDGVTELYTYIKTMRNPVDILAVNAGVGVGGDFAEDTSLDKELNLIHLNVLSSVHLTKLILKDMVQKSSGRILFTSSIAATMPGPFEAVYAASKAFIQSFAMAIRNEVMDRGVTVTCLMPGPTETQFFERANMEDTKVGRSEKDDPADVAREGYEALMAGKDHVVAGSFKNKLMTATSKVVPQKVSAEMHRKQSEPDSAKH